MRIRPITILVFGVFGVVLFFVGKLLLDMRQSAVRDEKPDAGSAVSRILSRPRGLPVPKFDVHSTQEDPPSFQQPEEPPPPVLAPIEEPSEEDKLREEAQKDGFVFREGTSPAVYIVKNRTRFHIPSVEEFRAMGLRQEMIREVPQGSVSFLRDQPPDGSVWRERDEEGVFLFEYGQKRWITSPEVFYRNFKFEDMRVIPDGALNRYPNGPPVY